jgi:DNA polymerase-3 subunit delta
LVWGGDEYRVSAKAKEILLAWCPPDQQDLGLEVFDGAVETIDEAVAVLRRTLDAVSTVGLFGGNKVVWLRDASFFSESIPGKYEAVKEAVAQLTEEIKRGLMPGQRLLISASKVHRGYAFYKACSAVGAVLEFDQPEKPREQMEQATATVQELLQAEGLKAPQAAIQILIDKAGFETRQLVQEVRKLATYLGDRRELTVEDVREMVSPSRESATWDLAEALGQRDLVGCLRLFRQLLFQKESPVALLMGIEGRVRDMLALRTLMERGYLRLSSGSYVNAVWAESPEAREAAQLLAGSLLKGHPFRLAMLAKSAAPFTVEELRRWYALAVRTHERMMIGGAPDELLLEFMMVDMIRGGRRAAS